MDNKEKETFNYTYSAKEQEEIKRIRKKYTAPAEEEDKQPADLMSEFLNL